MQRIMRIAYIILGTATAIAVLAILFRSISYHSFCLDSTSNKSSFLVLRGLYPNLELAEEFIKNVLVTEFAQENPPAGTVQSPPADSRIYATTDKYRKSYLIKLDAAGGQVAIFYTRKNDPDQRLWPNRVYVLPYRAPAEGSLGRTSIILGIDTGSRDAYSPIFKSVTNAFNKIRKCRSGN